MKTEVAKRMLEAARGKADEIGKPVTVAIVDAAGTLVVLERMNNAPAFTSVVAEGKASASAFSGRDSAGLANMAQNVPALTNAMAARLNGRFVPLQGAVVIRDDNGEIAGAIGVSGATSEEDEQIAKAGLAVLSA
jgi:glc operon protein GlcG